MNSKSALTLGVFITLGLSILGISLGQSLIKYKELDRIVTVKGLAEREVDADIVIWPIAYIRASNDLAMLYKTLEEDTTSIKKFLKESGFNDEEISIAAPKITDKIAQGYGGSSKIQFRYSAIQTLTLYSSQIHKARKAMTQITRLGKSGIIFKANNYEQRTEYIFTKLNEIKPSMIKEATSSARLSAQTFADDSKSTLGKIKRASQGQFSVRNRDASTPHIKRVRIVSTVVYYLSD